MFDYKKRYVFSLEKFIADEVNSGRDINDIGNASDLWAYEIDGYIVRYIIEDVGYCDGYYVHPDWCIEVDPYDM